MERVIFVEQLRCISSQNWGYYMHANSEYQATLWGRVAWKQA